MPFKIDLNEKFPHLPGAPIVEAVIHWQARAEAKLEADQFRRELVNRLPEYPEIRDQHEVQIEAKGSAADSAITQRTRWQGCRLERKDGGPYVAQLTFDGLIFSRLAPYDCWETFEAEALRLWNMFVELTSPAALQRLGVRFINRIALSAGEKPEKYLRLMPKFPKELDFTVEKFVHRDAFEVPDTSYRINLLRTIHPMEASGSTEGLILDIDVFASDIGSFKEDRLTQYLSEMHWLKNKVFFSCITPYARTTFEKEKS